MTRTVSIKLNIEDDSALREMAASYVYLLNDICDIAWSAKCFSYFSLYHLSYFPMREKYKGIKSNSLACAIRIVSASMLSGRTQSKKQKRPQTQPTFNKPVIGYDLRTSKITSNHCTLSTLRERIRAGYYLSPYQSQFFDGTWKIGGSKLILRKKGWFLNVSVSKEDPPLRGGSDVIGIDQGIRNIAVCSDNKFYSAAKMNYRTTQLQKRRGELKSKGTPSARKRLKKLSRRENRFRNDVLHCTVKHILSGNVDIIVLEYLKKGFKKKGRTINRKLSNWGFAKFRDILTYKSAALGIRLEVVDARYTSQKCSGCGETRKSNRKQPKHLYSCKCGLSLNDDLNAARNIQQNYALSIGEE
jgi:putative transposase